MKHDDWTMLILGISTLYFILMVASGVSGPAGVVLDAGQADTPTVALSGVSADVFNSTAFDIEPLGGPHYFSETQYAIQNDTPEAMALKNWSDAWIELPESFSRS
jgi:hypothetical protein